MAQYLDHTAVAQKLLDQQGDINRLTAERDGAYRERAHLFAHVEPVGIEDLRAQWDGHTTEEKYARIAEHAVELTQRCGPACSEMHTETGAPRDREEPMTVRLEILGDDGEWHELPGVASIELGQEQPDDPRDEAYRRHDALDALNYAMPELAGTVEVVIAPRLAGFREACARAEESMRRLAEQHPRVIDQDGNPVEPRHDRPAWQSPYGPPPRRR